MGFGPVVLHLCPQTHFLVHCNRNNESRITSHHTHELSTVGTMTTFRRRIEHMLRCIGVVVQATCDLMNSFCRMRSAMHASDDAHFCPE